MELLSKDYPLKCSICNKPLSVAPIYHNDYIGSICGRCTHRGILDENEQSSLERQIVLEQIAKYLIFPCSYQVFGCMVKLKWGSVERHENICPFNIIVCPLSHQYFQRKCSWIDQPHNLAEHMRKKHKNLFCIPPIMKISQKFQNKILCWELTGRVIIISLIFNDHLNKYLCFISGDFAPELCSSFQCCVEITSDKVANPMAKQHLGIQPFRENYLDKPENSFEINMNRFKNANELTLTFQITKEVNANETEFNQQLLQELGCPVCFEYMKPPIFICGAGHNICGKCSNKVDRCPICRENLFGGRNFTLETLTSKIQYPCVNNFLGCGFVGTSQQVTGHESKCQYIEITCLMKNCQWKGSNSNFRKHLIEEHSNILLQLDTIHVHDLNKKDQQYFLLHNDDIFVLKICFDINQPFKFAVLHYECETTSCNYDFKIIGCSSFGMNITLSDCCQPVPHHADLRDENYDVSSIPFDFLSQFMLSFSNIEFKLNITCENKDSIL